MGFSSPVVVASEKVSAPVTPRIDGLDELAALNSLRDVLSGMISRAELRVDMDAKSKFLDMGIKEGARPANFTGHALGKGFVATGNFQLRKRGSNSPLTDEEVLILDGLNIPYVEQVTSPATMYINPVHARNEVLLGKIDVVLKAAKDCGIIEDYPDDFVLQTEEVTKKFATETAIDAAFRTLERDALESTLPIVSVYSRGRYSVDNVDAAIESVRKVAIPELFGDILNEVRQEILVNA